MHKEPYFHLSAKFWRVTLAISFVTAFLLGYWDEIKLVWNWLIAFVIAFIQWSIFLPLSVDVLWATARLVLNIAIVTGGYWLLLFWMAQFALPVHSVSDKKDVFKRLVRHSLSFANSHGPAIFVREGKPIATDDELNGARPGVALVDLYSAIVLEKQSGNTGVNAGGVYFESSSTTNTKGVNSGRPSLNSVLKFSRLGRRNKKEIAVRAHGPGLVFTREGEKIIGWADLRKQFRRRTNVHCNTGDGIEVSTNISAVFTLGEPPEFLKVAQINGNWVIVKIEDRTVEGKDTKNTTTSRKLIKGFSDKLLQGEKEEINEFFKVRQFVWTVGNSENKDMEKEISSPFIFDERRVVAAVYSRARDAKEGRLGEWTDLPVDVAVDEFRNMLAHETYDGLYLQKDDEPNSIQDFKATFGKVVQKMGVLGYQIVRRKDGRALQEGQICRNTELVYSSPQCFQCSAVLRDRGIKVLAVGFSDLVPTNEIIRQQRFDNWRAHWQQETTKTLANSELQTMRIRNRERAKAQQDMIYSLSQILQTEQYTNEALTMRLYQALEAAATQPSTQRLLPGDTVQMLQSLRQWLLPANPPSNDHVDNEFVDGEEFSEEESAEDE